MKRHLKRYLIPHEENEHQPHLLRNEATKKIIATACAIELIILVLILPVRPAALTEKISSLAAIFPSVLVEKTNKTRAGELKGELAVSDTLVYAAQMKANDMAEKGYFAHNTPDGKTPWYWLDQAGYSYETAGENLAVNFVDSSDVHNAWLNSPSHRANIVRDGYTEIGIATAEGMYKGKKAIFVAQFFGTPKSRIDTFAQTPVQTQAVAVADTVPKAGVAKATSTATTTQILGAEIVTSQVEISTSTATQTVPVPASMVTATTTFMTKLFASPKLAMSFALWGLGILIMLALALKIFLKPKVQYSQLIMNGIIVVLLVLLFTFFNQHLLRWFAEIV